MKAKKKFTIDDINKILPLVAKVPVKLRCKNRMNNGRKHCATAWVAIKLGIRSGLFGLASLDPVQSRFTEDANEYLDDIMFDWDKNDVWPGTSYDSKEFTNEAT